MTEYGYALLGLTAAVAVLVAVLTFAALKFTAGAGDARRRLREGGAAEAALLSTAMQEAVARLQSQEQAVRARAAASERLSTRIVESLSAGLLVVEESGRIEIFNRAARRMLEIDGDAAGGDYRDVLKDVPQLGGVITECLATRRPIVRRSLSMMVGGKRCHFGVTVSSLRETEEQGAICLFSDITNVVELEEQLRLKDTLARLGELTAGIAHEFRNGLATIHGYSRLLDPGALPAAYRPYVEGIRQETDALGQIVTNFLNFARPENISFQSVAVGRIAQRAADDLRRELPEGTTTEVEGDFGDIQGDEVLLRQMFANLVRNAAEACDASGKRPQIVIRGAVDHSRGLCRVTVDDNGPGIAESDRDRVFQPFFTTRSRGTGLGLSVVQKIVVTHNGRVSVGRSTMGGASIEILFPVA
jgi:two-component system, NtrC family, nitrogen regulation sensor histidine kinase GlnL